jgi:hypothetical protein
MPDPRAWTLERALDDWISDLDIQGDFQVDGIDRAAAFAASVPQTADWIRRGVLIPGDLTLEGFVAWPGTPDGNAGRFLELSAARTDISAPGDIGWFDTGPNIDAELAALQGDDERS